MGYFYYTAMEHSGQLIRAEGEFDSVHSLFDTLQRDGMTLIRYRSALFGATLFKSKRIKRVILAEFFRNLALLLKGGVPLREAIADLVTSPGQPALSRVFSKIGRRLEEGMLFSQALEEEEKYIPKIILPLVAIGEETGNLDRTLEDAANHLDRIQEIISSTRRALTYPAFVLAAMFGAFLFWILYVLPQVLELFTTMGIEELPLATRILIVSISIFNTWWFVVPLFLILVFIVYLISRKNRSVRYYWDIAWSRMIIMGVVLRSSQLAFFFEYLGLLSTSGIHIVRALELMEQSVDQEVLKREIMRIRKEIMSGESMSDAIEGHDFFDSFVLRMIKVGEQTGSMPEQFLILADFYTKKVNNLVEALGKTLEPIIIVVAGFFFIIIVLGLLGPVYHLVSSIK